MKIEEDLILRTLLKREKVMESLQIHTPKSLAEMAELKKLIQKINRIWFEVGMKESECQKNQINV